jgi:hypothetical protein
MNERSDTLRESPGRGPEPGLCVTCRHRRDVVSKRGGRFVLCELSRVDPAFPRYPRLPVVACSGWQAEARP